MSSGGNRKAEFVDLAFGLEHADSDVLRGDTLADHSFLLTHEQSSW